MNRIRTQFDYRLVCERMPAWIVDYCLDPGELNSFLKVIVEQHVETCPDCAMRLGALQTAIENDRRRPRSVDEPMHEGATDK